MSQKSKLNSMHLLCALAIAVPALAIANDDVEKNIANSKN